MRILEQLGTFEKALTGYFVPVLKEQSDTISTKFWKLKPTLRPCGPKYMYTVYTSYPINMVQLHLAARHILEVSAVGVAVNTLAISIVTARTDSFAKGRALAVDLSFGQGYQNAAGHHRRFGFNHNRFIAVKNGDIFTPFNDWAGDSYTALYIPAM